MSNGTEGAVGNGLREQTRRALLAKAGLAGGAVGLASVGLPRLAAATPADANQDFVTVSDATKDPWLADNTGATDTRQRIQDCLDDSKGKAAVYLPPGTYAIGGAIKLDSNSALIGQGSLTVIKPTSTNTAGSLITTVDSTNKQDIRIEDLTLDGGGDNVNVAIAMAPSANQTFERIYIRRVEAKNIKPTRSLLTGYCFSLFGTGKFRVGAVQNCYIHNCGRDGIHLQTGDDFLIQGNVVEGCGDDHITVFGINNTIVGNVCSAAQDARGAAIAVHGNNLIVGNYLYGGVRGCIETRGSCTDVLIAGNALFNAGYTDASIGPLNPQGLPSWGHSRGSGVSILALSGDSQRGIAITDNQIFGPRNDGIVIAATAGSIGDVVISGNMIAMANPNLPPIQDTSLPGNGIALIGDLLDGPALGAISNVRICDNEIRQAKGAGISLKGNVDNSSARFDVLNNAVFDSGTQRPDGSGSNAPGIVVDHIKGFMVSSNRSQDTRSSKTQTYGLTVDSATGNNLVHGNDLTDNINSGVGGAATGYKSADNLGVEL